MKLLAILLALVFFAIPASAYVANTSAVIQSHTDTQFADESFLSYQYEILIIAMGFAMWLGMKVWQEVEVLFGLISLICFGVAAWFAPYLCINEVFTVVDMTDGTTTILYTQLVTPQPILQYILIVCFLFTLITTIYVTFLRQSDKVLDASNDMSGGSKL